MRFQDTKFWKNYSQYNRVVGNSSMRATVDAIIYWKLLTYHSFTRFVEVGVYQGLTTGLIFESSPACQVIGIDPVDNLDLFRKIYPEFQNQFTLLAQRSQEVVLNDQLFDFVLLDGDHSYQALKTDIINFLPRLKLSGILAIDDYRAKGVADSIKELYNMNTGWVPFLRTEQTEFWHHPSCDRGEFLDLLFTDPIGKFIFIENQTDEIGNTVCVARSLGIFTDQVEYLDLALKHYNV